MFQSDQNEAVTQKFADGLVYALGHHRARSCTDKDPSALKMKTRFAAFARSSLPSLSTGQNSAGSCTIVHDRSQLCTNVYHRELSVIPRVQILLIRLLKTTTWHFCPIRTFIKSAYALVRSLYSDLSSLSSTMTEHLQACWLCVTKGTCLFFMLCGHSSALISVSREVRSCETPDGW